MKKLLIIGAVFPEPSSTAAGGRMMRLIRVFQDNGFEVIFASSASISPRSADLDNLGIRTSEIELNNSNFNEFIKNLQPEVVMFDRFMTEEQFGWRVADECPDAIRILDTEDLHFLRQAREKAVKYSLDFKTDMLYSDTAKREIASIYRCDVSLIISEFEFDLLVSQFRIPEEILLYLPFSAETLDKLDDHGFNERSGFMTIGNFRHAPNLDSVKYLKMEVWPEIRKRLPNARIDVYGSYPTEEAMNWHSPKKGFYVHGTVENSDEVFRSARVCLAPLRFGAGLKGKLLDAMRNGTPSVTTKIGGEGMLVESGWGGFIEDDLSDFADKSVLLHNDRKEWEKASQTGFDLMNEKFVSPSGNTQLISRLKSLDLKEHRRRNFIGSILQFHTLRSTEFMSRWIEEKNKK